MRAWGLCLITALVTVAAKGTAKRGPAQNLRNNINKSRLFITIVSSSKHDDLCRGIETVRLHILAHTPGDIFVWSLNNSAQYHVASKCAKINEDSGVVFAPLGQHWETPANADDPTKWHWLKFNEDYRRMGHWRLNYPFAYGKLLGYKYLLQIDSDTNIQETLEHNLVEVMANGKFDIGCRRTGIDAPTWGLPELTRFFLIAEQLQPATLFQHCIPSNIDGLYTISSQSFPRLGASNDPWRRFYAENGGGWDRDTISGNFVLYDLDFWFREDVQKYLKLVLSTGGHFKFRWNEQAVVSMIWQIFVPDKRFKRFFFKYSHG